MPLVTQREERRSHITAFGHEGDGIGYIRGFVIIVPDAGIGQWVTVTIDGVYDNYTTAAARNEEPDLVFDQPPAE